MTNSLIFDKNSTNICKGIAIILMYIHHSFYSPESWSSADIIFFPITESQTLLLAKICKVCVAMFVFLSAYGVYKSYSASYNHDSYIDYYIPTVKKRYTSLLYNFFTIYLLSQILAVPIGRSRIEVYGEEIINRIFYTIVDALGLAYAFDTPTFNGTWWYMSLAFLLILVLPVIAKLADKLGYALIVICIILPLLCDLNMNAVFFRYLPVMVMGILCAKYSTFEKLKAVLKRNVPYYISGVFISLLIIMILILARLKIGYSYLFENALAMAICFFSFAMIEGIPLLNKVLLFLGKHSMNMFMIHTFIRSNQVNLHEFSYSPKYTVLILLLLIIDTLIISIAIEFLKKKIKLLILLGEKRNKPE